MAGARAVSRRTRRWLRLARTVVAVSLVLWLAAAWRSSAGPASTVPVPATAAPATVPVAPVAAATHAVDHGGPYRVGTTLLRYTDDHRPPPARQGGVARVVVSQVHYPVDGDPAAPGLADGPASAAGPFPLVVFAHGFDTTPASYDALTTAWARAGYVVVSPEFPGTVATPAGEPDESDLPNQVTDIAFVITSLAGTVAAPAGPLAGAVDLRRIAVAGHSDGAETVAALALDRCCADGRIKASIVMAGAELDMPGGSYAGTRHGPTLIIQGDADQTNDPSNAAQLYRDVTGPKWYLNLLGGDHVSPFTDFGGRWWFLPGATRDFLDWTLKNSAGGSGRFARDASPAGVATLTAG